MFGMLEWAHVTGLSVVGLVILVGMELREAPVRSKAPSQDGKWDELLLLLYGLEIPVSRPTERELYERYCKEYRERIIQKAVFQYELLLVQMRHPPGSPESELYDPKILPIGEEISELCRKANLIHELCLELAPATARMIARLCDW